MATNRHTTKHVSRTSIMRAAWGKFRKLYRAIPFREIGREGFAECLRWAWAWAWAWARAKAMATLVARGPALLKVELTEVARRMATAERAASSRGMSPGFARSMLADRRILASRERWLRAAIAFHPIAG